MAKKSRIIIPCRIAYLNCWEPCTLFGGKKYSLIAIIDKKDLHTLEMINETLEYVKNKSVAKWGGSIPANCKSPLHDGDVEKPDNSVVVTILLQSLSSLHKSSTKMCNQLQIRMIFIPDAMEMSASYFMAIMSEETRELLLCLGTFKRLKMARD